MSRQHDGFRYDPEDITFLEQFTVEPVTPPDIRETATAGQVLYTMDIPAYLDRSLAPKVDTGTALYRLTQLFGTPNVPGLEAGSTQPTRERTTWHYLFRVSYTPSEDIPIAAPSQETEFLLSAYDYKTDLSVGLSEWRSSDQRRTALEPRDEPLTSGDIPAEDFLVLLVQLILSSVEHRVQATFQDLWV